MKATVTSIILFALIVAPVNAFSGASISAIQQQTFGLSNLHSQRNFFLKEAAQDDREDDEIERLRSMAAKLRAEASALEVRFKFNFLRGADI